MSRPPDCPSSLYARRSIFRQWVPVVLLLELISLIPPLTALERVTEYQRFDGWFNNLANPQWGSVGSRLHRDVPSNYADGVYRLASNLPSARAISDIVFDGPMGRPSGRNLTTMFAFFSQVVAYEIMQVNWKLEISCPPGTIPLF